MMNDDEFRKLLHARSMSWQGYRRVRKGVKKRLRRHMRELDCVGIDCYIKCLQNSTDADSQCKTLMTVSISRFFRDRQLWASLTNRYIPELVKRFPEGIRMWSAGCAGGEEAYSFKILWYDLEKEIGPLPALDILATDSNPECIQRAQKGLFQSSSLRDVRDDNRSLFFSKPGKGKQYQITPDLTSSITFKQQDLLQQLPDRDFQIIFLRNNLLTYHQHRVMRPAFDNILNCLTPGGLLIIGAHEKPPKKAGPLQSCGPMVWKKVTPDE